MLAALTPTRTTHHAPHRQDDSFKDVPGILETESIAGASVLAMGAALDGKEADEHSYYLDAEHGETAEQIAYQRGYTYRSQRREPRACVGSRLSGQHRSRGCAV